MLDSPLHIRRQDALEVRLHAPAPGVAVVRVAGELDMFTAPLLREHLADQLPICSHVVVDLEEVRFIGSHGLLALVDAYTAARAAGVALFITATVGPAVARVLQITGLNAVLPLHDSGTDELIERLVHPRSDCDHPAAQPPPRY